MTDHIQRLLDSLKQRLADAAHACEADGHEPEQLGSVSSGLRELLLGYTIVQNGINDTPALASLTEHVNATNSTVSELRQRLQSRCENLQVFYPILSCVSSGHHATSTHVAAILLCMSACLPLAPERAQCHVYGFF